MSVSKSVIVACILLALIGGTFSPTLAQAVPDGQYFPETRHWVRGDFWTHFQSVENALFKYGYPYTREFIDPVTGNRVQYFQKVRLEMVETPSGWQVRVAPLGELMYDSTENQPSEEPVNPLACRRFETTGKLLCLKFLEFYDANDGPFLLGDPISNMEKLVDGRTVQYFRNGRLEWNASLAYGMRMKMTDLGRIYYDEVVASPLYTQPENPGDNAITSVNQLVAKVFIGKILVRHNEDQTIYVTVTDQFSRPISQARIEGTVTYPDGSKENFRMPMTDSKGISRLGLVFPDQPENSIISIQVDISTLGLSTRANTWFRVWW